MKLKAIRAHYLDGDIQAVGAVYETDERLGRQFIAAGKAVAFAEPAKKQKAKPEPMTVASTPALVAGAQPEKESTHELPSP